MNKLAAGLQVQKATIVLQLEGGKKVEFECNEALATYIANYPVAIAYNWDSFNPVDVVPTGEVSFDLHITYTDKEMRKKYLEAEAKYSELIRQK